MRLLDDGVRLLSLTGPGGVGKTRLALAVSREVQAAYRDGVAYVPLAAIKDPELVLSAIARALGLREPGTMGLIELLVSRLRDRHILLILDNFEQVREAAVPLTALLTACPKVVALVTSRFRLRVTAEHRFPTSPLAVPGASKLDAGASVATIVASPAVQLFVSRAQAIEPGFRLDAGNAHAIAAICRRLDGLPLAIELAAGRVRMLSPAEVLAHLDPALSLLTEGPADAPDRLRTMRRALAWSYDLLAPAEQSVLRRLAVFVGGCSLEAIKSVINSTDSPARLTDAVQPQKAEGAEPPSLLDTIGALIDASLLERQDLHGETRFVLLETIREFAWERLDASGELASVSARHAAWCSHMVETVRLSGSLSQRRGLDLLEAEQPNLRAALAWYLKEGQVTAALHLAASAAEFWLRHAHLKEGIAWLEQALAADDGAPTAAHASALVGLNMLLWPRANRTSAQIELTNQSEGSDAFARSLRLLDEAETVAHAADDAGALAYARLHQGYVAVLRGDFELADARGNECLTTYQTIPQGFSLHGVLWILAEVAFGRGEDERAKDLYGQLLARGRDGGDLISHANALFGLASVAERLGEAGKALRGFAEAAGICLDFGDRLNAGLCLERAAAIAVGLGWMEHAVRLFAAADAVHIAVTGEIPDRLTMRYRHRHGQALAVSRAAVGDERFAALRALGSALSLAEAIAEIEALAGQLAAAGTRPGARPAGLTAREQDIVRLLVEGYTDKEIAAALGIGRRTVSWHLSTIRGKLNAPSRTAAVAVALREGLV